MAFSRSKYASDADYQYYLECLWVDSRKQIFRLGISLIYTLYIEHKELIDSKLCYKKINVLL